MKQDKSQHNTFQNHDFFISHFPAHRAIKIKQLDIHPDIPKEIILATGSIDFKQYSPDIFSPSAAHFFVRKHPPEATLNSDGTAACFAGLRSVQIAQTCIHEEEEIFILIHEEIAKKELKEIAICDLYLSYLGMSSDDRLWPVNLAKIWQQLSKDERKKLTPKLQTKKQLSAGLNVPYQRLFPTRKFKKRGLKKAPKLGKHFPISDKKHPRDERIEIEKMIEKARQKNDIVSEIELNKKLAEL